ncbi:hypothetical protein [Fibrella aquatica]|uniref:hypothetical protein n=1 Tax=Fibrella aquatica TaxID=3242487 RepID=UPI003520A59F
MLTTNRLSAALLLTLTGSLFLSLLFKDSHMWMDEILSYLLLSDPSLAHVNQAIVSGMDANPPLFVNSYWLLAQGISLNPFFLKGISIGLFALTIVWFFRYITNLLDHELASAYNGANQPTVVRTALINTLVITAVVALTYLNYTLSTQIRTYSLYLLLSWGYVVVLHRLLLHPDRRRWLLAQAIIGTGFLFTHNVALFYLAGSGTFFGVLWLANWLIKKDPFRYLSVVGIHLLIAAIWLVTWYPSFAIQSESGKPHSWIPIPTTDRFFQTIGDLLPTFSARLEDTYPLLVSIRVLLVVGLFVWIALPRLRKQGLAALANPAFALYVLSGFLVAFTLLLGLAVSLLHTSVFLNRYFWPSSLLLLYQLLYAGWLIYGKTRERTWTQRLPHLTPAVQVVGLLLFMGLTTVFIVVQNSKVPLFSGEIRHDVARLKPDQPVLFESAYYFLPIYFYHSQQPIYYLLDWPTALDSRNVLESTTDYKILEGVADNYRLKGLIRPNQFNATQFNRFYVVDEASRYQIEAFIARGEVTVHEVIPANVAGHRILDCSFQVR